VLLDLMNTFDHKFNERELPAFDHASALETFRLILGPVRACFKSAFLKPAAAGTGIKPGAEPKAATLSQG